MTTTAMKCVKCRQIKGILEFPTKRLGHGRPPKEPRTRATMCLICNRVRAERVSERVECECGKTVARSSMYIHKKSARHLKIMDGTIEIDDITKQIKELEARRANLIKVRDDDRKRNRQGLRPAG